MGGVNTGNAKIWKSFKGLSVDLYPQEIQLFVGVKVYPSFCIQMDDEKHKHGLPISFSGEA